VKSCPHPCNLDPLTLSARVLNANRDRVPARCDWNLSWRDPASCARCLQRIFTAPAGPAANPLASVSSCSETRSSSLALRLSSASGRALLSRWHSVRGRRPASAIAVASDGRDVHFRRGVLWNRRRQLFDGEPVCVSWASTTGCGRTSIGPYMMCRKSKRSTKPAEMILHEPGDSSKQRRPRAWSSIALRPYYSPPYIRRAPAGFACRCPSTSTLWERAITYVEDDSIREGLLLNWAPDPRRTQQGDLAGL